MWTSGKFVLMGMFIFTFFSMNNYCQTTKAIRINCGGSEFSIDTITFSSDKFYTGTFYFRNDSIPDIFGTTYDQLYKSERASDTNRASFSYNIPVDSGDYTVYLHFAEIYWGVPGGEPGGIGSRIFSVDMEGINVLQNYDIYAEVGPATAVVKSFAVSVTDDTLNIFFYPTANRPKVSAIEIIPPGEAPLSVDINKLNHEPVQFILYQNYPNPFNPITNIKFCIEKAGIIKIIVYNIIGEKVEELQNDYKEAGTYNLKFNADKLSSGIYIYRLVADNFQLGKAMLLLK